MIAVCSASREIFHQFAVKNKKKKCAGHGLSEPH